MDAVKIFNATIDAGVQTTLAEVRAELSTFDRLTLVLQHRERIAIELWDGESPINDIPAERVRQSENLPAGAKGYWVFVDGKPAYLQLTSPFAGERVMTDPEPIAERHRQALAEDFADQAILQTIIARLRERADTRLQAIEDGLLALMLGGMN